jgi:hypothetical protein
MSVFKTVSSVIPQLINKKLPVTKQELRNLMCQFGISSWGGTRKLPLLDPPSGKEKKIIGFRSYGDGKKG